MHDEGSDRLPEIQMKRRHCEGRPPSFSEVSFGTIDGGLQSSGWRDRLRVNIGPEQSDAPSQRYSRTSKKNVQTQNQIDNRLISFLGALFCQAKDPIPNVGERLQVSKTAPRLQSPLNPRPGTPPLFFPGASPRASLPRAPTKHVRSLPAETPPLFPPLTPCDPNVQPRGGAG